MTKTIYGRFLLILGIIILSGFVFFLSINFYVIFSTRKQILSVEEAQNLADVDAILVLGCQVRSDQTPSAMLEDRLTRALELYHRGVSKNLLMSGDHGTKGYNEVQVMKDYAISHEIPSSDVYMDHAGFSTYDSIYRARDVFKVKKVIIVTQGYHLFRALMIANHLGLEAYGVRADTISYSGQMYREIREVLARNKDFFLSLLSVKPTYLGDEIPVFTDGNLTND